MWKSLYLGILFILVLIVFTSTGLISKKKDNDKVIKCLFDLLVIALFAILFNGIFVISEMRAMGHVAHSLFTATIDWLLMTFVIFTMEYTGYVKHIKKFKLPMLIFSCMGTASAFANIFLNNQFETEVVFEPGFGYCCHPTNYTVMYNIHLYYCYLLVGIVLLMLIQKLYNAPKVYKIKYVMVLLSFSATIVIDMVGLILKTPVDLSLIAYCVTSIMLCYFTIVYIPNSLIQSSLINAVEHFDVGLVCFDTEHHCIYVNEMAKSIYNKFDATRIVGNDYTPVENYAKNWFAKNGTDERGKVILQDVKDQYRTYSFEVNGCKLYDKRGNSIGYYLSIADRTEEIEKYQLEHYKATHDPLTGLYNDEYFFERVEETLRENPSEHYMLLTTDIKNFKLINDMLGYETGDELLKMHAKVFRDYAKEGDIYGKIGIDKFGYFMPKVRFQSRDFVDMMDYLRKQFSNQFFRVQIYLGAYEIVDRREPAFAMCDKCNLAIESIKGDYFKRIAFYNDKVMEEELSSNSIINGFGDALENDEFKMYLQAQTDNDGKVTGAEALVRWDDDGRIGMRYPTEFIGVLEKARLIHLLDTYMWEHACIKLAEWKNKGIEDMYISVNISVEDQYYMDIYRVLTDLVEKYKINPKNLKLEITESIFVTDLDKHVDLVERLRKYGFDVEIDDFGSGYSSLTILKDISADVLKLDMEFLHYRGSSEKTQEILKGIISMAKNLGMQVISEGVETKDQFEMMRNLGCDLYQGYYFSKPIPVEEFEEKYLSDDN
ncbi:MAG: EAL domain-containing protein [Lachnospiraceae bacterium]|nr:EAL domain-containing protein [Lachnospiraceae bacterium]